MKKIKSLLTLILTLMLVLTSFGINTNKVSADSEYSLEIVYGYGRSKGSTWLTAVFSSSTGGAMVDTGYSLYGERTTAYNSSTGTNQYTHPTMINVDYVEFRYGDQTVICPHATSAKGNSIIKGAVYINGNGVLSYANGTTAKVSGAQKTLMYFAASADSASGNISQRWYIIDNQIKVIYHYYDENVITVNGVSNTLISDDYDSYFTTINSANNSSETIISANKTFTDGLTQSFELLTENPLASVSVGVGSNNASALANGVQYLSSSYTFSDTHASGDILAIDFDNNQIIYYVVNNDISVNFVYATDVSYDVTFMVNNEQYGEVQTVGEGITASRPSDPEIPEGYNRFVGWYLENSDEEFSFNTPITSNTTLYARFILSYTATFNNVNSVSSSAWVDNAGGTGFEEVNDSYIASTDGIYSVTPDDSLGFQIRFDYSNSIEGATIEYGNFVAELSQEDLVNTCIKYLDSNGTWHDSLETLEEGTYLFKYAHTKNQSYAFFRVWTIDNDLTFTANIPDRVVTFTNFGHRYGSNSGTYLNTPYVSISATELARTNNGKLFATPQSVINENGVDSHNEPYKFDAYLTNRGDFSNTSGVGGSVLTYLEDLDKITFTFEGHDPIVLDCRDADNNLNLLGTAWHIDSNYQLQTGQGSSSDILRWVINTTSNNATNTVTISFRFFKITENVDISATYVNQHSIVFVNAGNNNHEDKIWVGAYSNSSTAGGTTLRVWNPYGSGTSNSLRNGGSIDYKNGIATVYGDYKNIYGAGAAILTYVDHNVIDRVVVHYGAYEPFVIDISTYQEAQINKSLYVHEDGTLDDNSENGTKVAQFVHNQNADFYNVRFYEIKYDYSFEATTENATEHTVTINNASAVSASEWATKTYGVGFTNVGNNEFKATIPFDYKNTSYTDKDGVRGKFDMNLGDIDGVTFSFDDVEYSLTAEDFEASKIFYLDSNGEVFNDASDIEKTYIFKFAYSKGDLGFYLRFFNITTDINVTIHYKEFINIKFIYNNEEISSQNIKAGEAPIVPSDPYQEEGKVFMWFSDEECTKLANPEARLTKSIAFYGGLAENIHKVYMTGLGFQYRSVSTPAAYLSCSTWEKNTKGFVNTETGYFVSNGDYVSESGTLAIGRTSNYYVDKVEFRVGDAEPVYLSSNSSDNNYFITTESSGNYWYLTSQGTLEKRASKAEGDILRFRVISKSDTAVNVTYYNITEDIHITLFYKMSMKVVINNDGSLDMNICSYVPKTVRNEAAYAIVNDQKVMLSDMDYIDYGVGDRLYSYTLAKIAPKQVADETTVQFFDSYDNYLNTEKTISVKQYLETIISDSYECSNNLKQFAKDLLNYAGESQTLWNYNTDNLANIELSSDDKDLSNITSETLEPYKVQISGETEGIRTVGQSLSINKNTDFKLYFVTNNDINDYVFMDGTEIVEPTRYGNYQGEKLYYVRISGVAAPDLINMHDISVKYQGAGDYVVSCNVLTYVGLCIRDNDEYTIPMKALYKLAVSAAALKQEVHVQSTIFDSITPYDGKELKVAFVGDSITFGYASTDPAVNSYPSVLDSLLGNKFNIGNFGMSGSYVLNPYKYPNYSSYVSDNGTLSSTNANKFYMNTYQYENSIAFEPDIVIIMEGTNDQRSIARYGDNAKAAYKEGLTDLIEAYQALPSVSKVYVMTSIIVHPDSTPEASTGLSYNDVADGILCDLQIEVANSVENCGLIDLHHLTYEEFGGDNYRNYFAGDLLHPNDVGYRLMAERIYGVITETARQLSYRSYDSNSKAVNKELFYTNETTEWGADPTVIYINDGSSEDGYFYLYATSGYINSNGIECWRSKNLTDWECMGAAFLPDTDEDWAYKGIWAPSITYNETTGLYYLFYSAAKETKTMKDANDVDRNVTYRYDSYATSSTPYGPFVNSDYKDEPMLKFEDHVDEITNTYYLNTYLDYESADGKPGYVKAIGPRIFVDDDGQTYLFFCADLDPYGLIAPNKSCAYALKLDLVGSKYVPDYSSLTKITEYGKKKFPESYSGQYNVAEFGNTNEGPVCFKYGDKYYLTFLTSTYIDEKYQTRLAVADNVLGPYTKFAPYDEGVVAKTYSGMQRICIGVRDIFKVSGSDSDSDKYYAAYMTFWNNETYTPQSIRKFAIDEIVPIKNDNGDTVFQVNGPSVTPQELPQGISGYENLAQLPSSKLTISSTSSNASTELLTDGLIPYSDRQLDYASYSALSTEEKGASKAFAAKEEYYFSEDSITITFDFANYVDLRSVMVYNSKDNEYKFDVVDSITLAYKKNGQTGEVTMTSVKFNNDYYVDGKYTIGAAAITEFADIAVNKVSIKISKPSGITKVGIPEIKLLGKEDIPNDVLTGIHGALYDTYAISNQSVSYNDWKNCDSLIPIDCEKESVYTYVATNSNAAIYSYKGEDGVYIFADINDNSVQDYTQEIASGRYNVDKHSHFALLLGESKYTSLNKNVVAFVVDAFNETFRYKGASSENSWIRSWVKGASSAKIKDDYSGYFVEIFVPYSELGGIDSSATLRMIATRKSSSGISSTNPSTFTFEVK